MFCSNCGSEIEKQSSNFCSSCGQGVGSRSSSATPDDGTSSECSGAEKSHVMSLKKFINAKGKQWKEKVTTKKEKKKNEKEIEVVISIGLMQYKDAVLKPVRGKRVIVKVPNLSGYKAILEKAEAKFKAYYSNCYVEGEKYILLYESGCHALFMPGGTKDFFCLKKYQEETGKDYKRIVLYLCLEKDFDANEKSEYNSDEDVNSGNGSTSGDIIYGTTEDNCEDNYEPSAKKFHVNNDDELLAMQIQAELNEELSDEQQLDTLASTSVPSSSSKKFSSCESFVNQLKKRVNTNERFSIVVRRGATLSRMFKIWKRAVTKSSPENVLSVQFAGEMGSDGGAIAKEFLSILIDGIRQELFPGGCPVDSMLKVHDGMFLTAGQVTAVSIVQGGPPPALFEESVFKLFAEPDQVDLAKLADHDFTPKDCELFKQIRDDPVGNQDMVIDHGYTGVIDLAHSADIIGTVEVSIISKRLVFLKEFKKGMELYCLNKALEDNMEIARDLFVCKTSTLDANYVVSILCPNFSEEGSNRRHNEETIFDNLQDFIMSTEDDHITGFEEEIAWNETDDANDFTEQSAHVQSANISPAGILGWLTGQKHQPLDGQKLSVSVMFDHECLERDPRHTICFPLVGACARVITFPVCHMVDPTEFKRIMLLAFWKGQAFGKL